MNEPFFDAPALATAVTAHRVAHAMMQYEAAQQIGITTAMISRVEGGHVPEVESLARILVWLGRTFESFIPCMPALPVAPSAQSKVLALVGQDTTLRQPGRDALLSAIGVLYQHYGERQAE